MQGSRDSYDGYYVSDQAGVIGKTNNDERLDTKDFVIGVELENTAVAYPFAVLNQEPVINDAVDGSDLLIVFDSKQRNRSCL